MDVMRFYGGNDPEEKARVDKEIQDRKDWEESYHKSYRGYIPPHDGVSYS